MNLQTPALGGAQQQEVFEILGKKNKQKNIMGSRDQQSSS